MFVLLTSAVLATVLTIASVAAAQPTNNEQALALFERAAAHFDSGEFERSALLLQEAIELHDIAILHHNLGRALQEMGRWADARAEYERYLEMDPDTAERSRIEARVAQIDERLHELEDTSESHAPISNEPPVRSAPRSPNVVPWVVLGVGALTLGVAVALSVLFEDTVTASRQAADHRMASQLARDAELYAITADVLFVSGGAVALAGLIWGIVDLSLPDDGPVDVAIGPTGVWLTADF